MKRKVAPFCLNQHDIIQLVAAFLDRQDRWTKLRNVNKRWQNAIETLRIDDGHCVENAKVDECPVQYLKQFRRLEYAIEFGDEKTEPIFSFRPKLISAFKNMVDITVSTKYTSSPIHLCKLHSFYDELLSESRDTLVELYLDTPYPLPFTFRKLHSFQFGVSQETTISMIRAVFQSILDVGVRNLWIINADDFRISGSKMLLEEIKNFFKDSFIHLHNWSCFNLDLINCGIRASSLEIVNFGGLFCLDSPNIIYVRRLVIWDLAWVDVCDVLDRLPNLEFIGFNFHHYDQITSFEHVPPDVRKILSDAKVEPLIVSEYDVEEKHRLDMAAKEEKLFVSL